MSQISEFFTYMAAWALLMGGMAFFFNFMTKGFMWHFMKVKPSQGRKIMVAIKSASDKYYRAGDMDGDRCRVKLRNGEFASITNIDSSMLTHAMGVFWLDYDEVNKAIIRWDGKSYPSIDPVKTDSVIERSILRPQEQDKMAVVIIILIVLILMAVIAEIVIGMNNKNLIIELGSNIAKAATV